MAPEDSQAQRQATRFEFHFQEYFTGEEIEILTAGEVRARIVATTRFQIGMAGIEQLELQDGEEVTIRVVDPGLEATVNVNASRPFVIVNLLNGELHVESTATSPGYL